MFRDPIVEEVRAIREQLAAQFDFDIRKIIADVQKRQATSNSRIVSFQGRSSAVPPGTPLEQSVSEEGYCQKKG
jgi:hypothetical protein